MNIENIEPKIGLPGGRITITCTGLDPWELKNNSLKINNKNLHIIGSSTRKIIAKLPSGLTGKVNINLMTNNSVKDNISFFYATFIEKGFNISDSPALDNDDNIYTTIVNKKNKKLDKTIVKITQKGKVSKYIENITEVTSITFNKNGDLLILSNEDENLYIANKEGKYKILSINLGRPSGVVVDSNNNYFVGNIEGKVYKIQEDGNKSIFVKVPPSYMTYHMSIDSKDNIYLTNPNHIFDSKIYKITPEGNITTIYSSNTMLRGLTVDKNDKLYFIESKRGLSYVCEFNIKKKTKYPILSGEDIIGLSANSKNDLIIATKKSLYLLERSVIENNN